MASRFAISSRVDPLEERALGGDIEFIKMRMKHRMIHDLAATMIEQWGQKEPTRDPFTGALVLTFDVQLAEDSDIERWQSIGRIEGRAQQRRIDRESLPYGFDEVYT